MVVYLKDDDDEFEHLQDDDEFEGFDKERNVKGSGHEKPPDLKITKVSAIPSSSTIYELLKLKFSQYSSILTNYIISHCTTLQYNHNI